MKVLVTGGTGYIGSHTVVELLNNGIEVVVIDNLSNSKIDVIEKIKEITKKSFKFYKGDVADKKILNKIFGENDIDVVIHFAGYKAVFGSILEPIKYYQNNLNSTLNLCEVMNKHNVYKIIFSSSATVYGENSVSPIKENSSLSTTNPYGSTKLMNEMILKDLYISNDKWGIVILRYFNPIGAHKSGLIGENPNGIPNNLMPYVVKVATKEIDCLNIFGNDYDTVDGTCVRDFIHVVDLAKGHIKALEKIIKETGVNVYNLGTGKGYSVLELVKTFEKVNSIKINYKFTKRRKGDIGACYADPYLALKELNWKAEKGLEEMCKDAYKFYIKNKQ